MKSFVVLISSSHPMLLESYLPLELLLVKNNHRPNFIFFNLRGLILSLQCGNIRPDHIHLSLSALLFYDITRVLHTKEESPFFDVLVILHLNIGHSRRKLRTNDYNIGFHICVLCLDNCSPMRIEINASSRRKYRKQHNKK